MIYLLVEQKKDTLKKLFSGQFQYPQIDYLFDNTEMSHLKNQSPLIIQDTTVSDATLHEFLEKQSGLLITSHVPKDQLLKHLRHIMLVYFSPEQFGLFRYYDPFVASYFFTSLNQIDSAFWLGPISQLKWYNVTWRERVNSQDQWQSYINTEVDKWQLQAISIETKPLLNSTHIQVLGQMQQEKLAYKWWQNNNSKIAENSIDQVINWVKEAIHIGCWTDSEVETFLEIRSRYPTKPLPEVFTSQDIKQKLAGIEHDFETTAELLYKA